MSHLVNVLTIAGSDSGGGAGIQADLKTFSANGVYGASVITALTAQNTQQVTSIHSVPPAFVRQQLEAVFADIQIAAVKTGMLGDAAMVAEVADFLKSQSVKLVVDPVMIAKSGDALLQQDAIATLIQDLIPQADLITPNLPEGAALLGIDEPTTVDEMKAMSVKLYELGAKHVLLKGGHLEKAECPDLLFDGKAHRLFQSPRINTRNTHGTGCTLASAITAFMARGYECAEAVEKAKDYISAAIRAADELNVGNGHGPVHHFHAVW